MNENLTYKTDYISTCLHYLPGIWNMGVRKRKPMVNYTWLNVDFEIIFGVD